MCWRSNTVSNTDPMYFSQGTKVTVREKNHQVTPPTVQLIKPAKEECRNQNDRKKTLLCVASGFYPDHVSMSWEQNGKEVKDGFAIDTALVRPEGEEYYKICSRLTVSADDWLNPYTQFKCHVDFFDGTSNTIKTDVVNGEPAAEKCQVTAPTVAIVKPAKQKCINGTSKALVCVASDFYPDRVSVSWQRDGEEVTDGVTTDAAALWPKGKKLYNISSSLTVSAETWFNPDSQFKCIVKICNGTSEMITTDAVYGEPVCLSAPGSGGLTRDKYLMISQTAKLSYAVFIAKSCVYGAFVAFLLYNLQKSAGKKSH